MNGLDKLTEFVAAHEPEASEDSLQRGRSRFIEATRLAVEPRGWSARYRLALWLLPAAFAGVGLVWALREPVRISEFMALQPAPGGGAARLEAPAQGPSSLELEPGTTAELSQGTLAYASTKSTGERRVDLVHGKLRLRVDPTRKTSWTVTAGSTEVRVVGTVFSVERDPLTKEVRVDVERGRVRVVSGSDRVQQVELSAGQSLVAHAERLEVLGASAPASPQPSGAADPVEGSPPTEPSATEGSSAALPSVQELFQARYRARDYRGALGAAEEAGFEGLLSSWDRALLARLADAARLAGRPERAQRALARLRERFPGSREGADAAFLLGRLHADALRSPGAAADWFERYLAESAGGAYAQEAEGRLMVAARAAGDTSKARSVASRYLERYPEGPYAKTALSLLR